MSVTLSAVLVVGALFAAMTGCGGGAADESDTGGGAGAGGMPLESGLYAMECSVTVGDDFHVPVPIHLTLNATAARLVADGGASALTTSASVIMTDLCTPLVDPATVFFSAVELVIAVQGADPMEIVHRSDSMIPAGCAFETESQITEVTPDPGATTVTLEITHFSLTVSGFPESLVPGGEITFADEDSECGEIRLREGSSVTALPVYP